MSDPYTERATLHRPKTLPELRATVHQMLAQGFSDYGIAAALQIGVEQVRRLAIAENSDCMFGGCGE